MGQAKQKQLQERMGARVVSEGLPNGTRPNAPPTGNTGGNTSGESSSNGNPSATDRNRVNLSVPPGLYAAISGAADSLGMTVAQAALMAMTTGLPALAEQARAVKELSK